MSSPAHLDNGAEGLYVGLISGTSMDGVDAALVHLSDGELRTVATATAPYPSALRARLQDAIEPDARLTLHAFATLDIEVGLHFAATAQDLLRDAAVGADDVVAIGSHGQTLRHHALPPFPYSVQIGNPSTIAAATGITTVADFRSLDIALGGQGAPLVPPFHQWCFGAAEEARLVVNIGGIANVSLLPGAQSPLTLGYDSGPGNCLMDDWIRQCRNVDYDVDGSWAESGIVIRELFESLLTDPFFAIAPPKSTGREYFNHAYVVRHLTEYADRDWRPEDIQSTLCQLTVETIAAAIEDIPGVSPAMLLVCGGGARNASLIRRLRSRLPTLRIEATDVFGINPDFVEASAFAWFAYMRVSGFPIRLTTSTPPHLLYLGTVHEPRVGE